MAYKKQFLWLLRSPSYNVQHSRSARGVLFTVSKDEAGNICLNLRAELTAENSDAIV